MKKAEARPFIKTTTFLYTISLVLLFLKTFYWKFFWTIPEQAFLILSLCTGILYFLNHKMYFSNRKKVISLLLIIFYAIHVMSNAGQGLFGIFLTILNVVLILEINQDDMILAFKTIKIVFAIICLISLAGWIAVNLLHIGLPMHYSQYGIYQFYDYGIFNMRVEGISFSRYLGMFLEPGYTGVMCVLLVCCDRFDLRKVDNIILIVCALFTLSLAAYLLIALFWILHKPSLRKAFSIVITILGVALILALVSNYVPELKRTLDYFVIDRLDSMLSGNIFGNRFSNSFNYFFNKNILKDPWNFFFGIGSVKLATYSFSAAGFKVLWAQDGLFNLIIILVVNYILCMGIEENDHRWDNYVLFFIWLFNFIDIAYPTWVCFQILMICGPTNYRNASVLTMNGE